MSLRTLLWSAAALLALAAPATGQELQRGTRVRVTAPIIRGDSRFVGTVTSTDNGRIVLRLDPSVRQDARDSISIPRSLVRRVEVSLGPNTGHQRRDAARTGAVAGLVAGVAVGMVVGRGSDSQGVKDPLMTSLWLGPAMAALGAGTGALVGRDAHEVWRTVPRTSPVAITPSGRSVTVSIRLGF
jgi:hypothetical protein